MGKNFSLFPNMVIWCTTCVLKKGFKKHLLSLNTNYIYDPKSVFKLYYALESLDSLYLKQKKAKFILNKQEEISCLKVKLDSLTKNINDLESWVH